MAEIETFGSLIQKNWGKIAFSFGFAGGILAMKYGPRIPEMIGEKLAKSMSKYSDNNSPYQTPDLQKIFSTLSELTKKVDELYRRFDGNDRK